MINAGSAAAYLTLDRSAFSAGLKSAYQELNTFLDNTETAGSRIQALGGAMTTVGSMMTKSFTVPIVGAGAIMTKFAMDFESGLAKVSTVADESQVSMKDMGKAITDLSSETGIAATEIANNVYDAISAGQSTGDAVNFVSNSTKLAKAGFAEAGESLDLLTTILNSYGMASSEVTRVSDILINTQNVGKLVVKDMASVMGKSIPTAKAFGINLENISSAYAVMTSKGINAAETTTYVNAAINELGKSGTLASDTIKEISGQSFPDLIASGKSLGDVFAMMDDYAKKNGKSMTDLFGSSEAAKAGMVLATNSGKDFNDVLKSMDSAAGATDIAFKKVSNTTQEKLTKSINKFKNAGIELGTTLLPMATDMVESVTDLAEKFNGLDDSTKDTIITAGKLIAVLGPTVSIAGKLTTGVGALAKGIGSLTTVSAGAEVATGAATIGLSAFTSVVLPAAGAVAILGAGFYAAHEANDVLNSSVIKSKEEYSGMEKVMASLMGVQLQSRDELERQGVIYKEFNKNISEEFKSSVVGMRKEILDFNFALNEINFDGVFDEGERVALEGRVSDAVDSAIQAINTKNEEMNSAMSNLFATDGILSEEETSIMSWWSSRGDKEKEEAKKLQDEVNSIELQAFNEGRKLTPEEIKSIEDRFAQIKQIELLAKTKNNDELLFVQKEFETQVVGMNAKAASNLLIEKRKQADEILQQKRVEIEVLKAQAKQGWDEKSEEEKKRVEESNKLLDESYNQLLNQQEGYYQSSIQFLEDHNKNAYDKINKFNGEVLKENDVKYYQSLVNETKYYEDINALTESGYYKMKNTATGAYEDIYVKVDDTTKKLQGVYNINTRELGAMTEKDARLLEDEYVAWRDTTDGIKTSLTEVGNFSVDTQGTITDSWGRVIGTLGQVKDENGKLVDSILDVNGNPINIGDNTASIIQALKNTRDEVQKTNGQKAVVTVTDNGTADNLLAKLSSITNPRDALINVTSPGLGYATGTDVALSGVTTIAEYGPELIVGNSGAMLAADRQLMNFTGGEKVYNARQTQGIFSNNKTNSSNENIAIEAARMIVGAIKSLDSNIEKAVKETNTVVNITDDYSPIDVDRIPMRELQETISRYLAVRTISRR